MRARGIVYLVGAGPGDPGLLTVRGLALLRRADVVIYDRLVAPRLLQECRPDAKLVPAGRPGERYRPERQRAINRALIREARAGRQVVRLKGGDPFLFGRGGEEALALRRSGVPFEVVPGVSSVTAVPAYAGIPITHRACSSSVGVITGREDPRKRGSAIRWEALAGACDTLVCLMTVKQLRAVAERLRRAGKPARTPCALIERGATPAQRTVSGTLGTIARLAAEAAIHPPATLVVGDVVRLRRQLAWFEQRPLFGRRILVTRAAEKADELAERLEALGADVEQLPAIELRPVNDNGAFRQAIREMPETDWIFFTSPEGIAWFIRLLRQRRKDLRWLAGCRIAAIGPKTAAAIEERGLHVDFIPRRFNQEGVLDDLPARLVRGKRVLIFSALKSRTVLEAGLRARGMRATRVPIYRTVIPRALRAGVAAAFRRPFDAVTVTSASCVEHLAQAMRSAGKGALFRRLRFASIGPVTSRAVRARGGRVLAEADPSTIDGLIDAISRAV